MHMVEQLLRQYVEKKFMLCEVINAKKCSITLHDVSGKVPINLNEKIREDLELLNSAPHLEVITLTVYKNIILFCEKCQPSTKLKYDTISSRNTLLHF